MIQIVIDIPEEQYITLNAKTQDDVVTVIDSDLLIKAIANGIVLPKHGRLIDADAFMERISSCLDGEYVLAPTILEATRGGYGK